MSTSGMQIAFIGSGVMGEVMLAAILERKLSAPEDIRVSDIQEPRLLYLKTKYRVHAAESNFGALQGSEIVVLAIKPQNLAAVAVELNGKLRADQLLLSIVAGASIATLAAGFNHKRIVRVMPNTPARIGEGMSVWTASAPVTAEQSESARSILGSMGKELYVEDEANIDMATAVSGSGPAYVFLFMESLLGAAEAIGLPGDIAKGLVLQTVIGASRYAEQSGKPLAELRRMVTSPGGTTAEAISQFEKGDFPGIVRMAVRAAYEKAKKLVV